MPYSDSQAGVSSIAAHCQVSLLVGGAICCVHIFCCLVKHSPTMCASKWQPDPKETGRKLTGFEVPAKIRNLLGTAGNFVLL